TRCGVGATKEVTTTRGLSPAAITSALRMTRHGWAQEAAAEVHSAYRRRLGGGRVRWACARAGHCWCRRRASWMTGSASRSKTALPARPKTKALGCAPPARAWQRKAPQDRFVCIEQHELATTRLVLEGGEFERAGGEISRGRIKASGGAVVAQSLFLRRSGRSHGQAGPRSVGPTPWPMRGNSIGKRGSHAVRGLDRRGDCGAVPTRRSS